MIRAIETKYKGYRFRSFLEYRWAVFFDALGLRWEYEYQGFDLPEIWYQNYHNTSFGRGRSFYAARYYLPDFWLPDYQYWIEIKGQSTLEEQVRVGQVAHGTGYHGFVCESVPGNTTVDDIDFQSVSWWWPSSSAKRSSIDCQEFYTGLSWREAPDGQVDLCVGCTPIGAVMADDFAGSTYVITDRVKSAIQAARSARPPKGAQL